MTRVQCFAFCLLAFPLLPSLVAQEIQAPEPRVKAAFLYNFTKLVNWPTNAFASSDTPLVIGVLGRDPFGKELDNILAGRKTGGRTIQAARFKSVEEVEDCHVLFISDSERRKLKSIQNVLKDKPILTVGDTKGFVEHGMIELVKSDETINLRINLDAANQAGLQLSSRLTRLDKTLQPLEVSPTNAPPEGRN